ncbi:MAG: DUF3880 domain-containing protein [Roseburia sp.]|nr:DUF3880 domain-containing protein [Roseburia sp.]
MRLLFLEWKSFGNEDVISAFEALGHTVKRVPFNNRGVREDQELQRKLADKMTEFTPDFVFTFNYFPLVSLACKEADTIYVAWVYDSPYVLLYSYTIIYPKNYVFVFDKELYLEFHNAGIPTIHYLPLAANTERLNAMTDLNSFRKTDWYNQHDIAFVGSLYTEKHQFYQRLEGITPYTRGYLEGLISAQKKIYGYNFIQELLPEDIIADMKRILPMQPDPSGVETIEYLFAQYVINRQITAEERQELLSAIANHYPIDIYTPDKSYCLKNCTNHGPVDYYDFAPYVFKTAKINLNISLRSIKSGIPLRAFDIMGAGGFLLTNYQADFLDYFIPGEDFVYFESYQDLMDKLAYYLTHEKERAQIARNGFEKVAEQHTYLHRVQEILSYLSH